MEELRLKKNVLGGKIYLPKDKEQTQIELAQMELASRKLKETINGKENN